MRLSGAILDKFFFKAPPPWGRVREARGRIACGAGKGLFRPRSMHPSYPHFPFYRTFKEPQGILQWLRWIWRKYYTFKTWYNQWLRLVCSKVGFWTILNTFYLPSKVPQTQKITRTQKWGNWLFILIDFWGLDPGVSPPPSARLKPIMELFFFSGIINLTVQCNWGSCQYWASYIHCWYSVYNCLLP